MLRTGSARASARSPRRCRPPPPHPGGSSSTPSRSPAEHAAAEAELTAAAPVRPLRDAVPAPDLALDPAVSVHGCRCTSVPPGEARPRLGRDVHRPRLARGCDPERFGDQAVFERPRSARYGESLAAEVGTIRRARAAGGLRLGVEHVALRPGLRARSPSGHGAVIVSSGLPQTIEPVLAREGVEVELVATTPSRGPDGWRLRLARRRAVPGLRRPLQAARAAGRAAARLRRRRLLRPLRRARRRPRLRARATSPTTSRSRGPPVRAVRDASTTLLLRFPEPYDFALSTERFRAFGRRPREPLARGRAAPRRRRRARCGSRRRPAASTSSRSTRETAPVVEKLLGARVRPRRRSAPGPRRSRCSASSCPKLDGLPPAARAGSVREPRHLDHRAAGLALRGVRDPHRLIERFGVRGRASRTRFPTRERLAAASEDELVALGFSRRKAEYVIGLARADLDLDELAGAARRRGPRAAHGAPRARPVDGRMVPRAPPRAAARVAGRRPRPAQGGRSSSTVSTCTSSARASIPFQNLSAHYLLTGLRVPADEHPPRHDRRRGRAPRALGGVRARGARAAGRRARDVGGGVGRRPREHSTAAPSSSPRTTRARSGSRAPRAPERGRSHLEIVYVRPRARRQGVAKALLRACVEDVKAARARRASRLDVLSTNDAARATVWYAARASRRSRS